MMRHRVLVLVVIASVAGMLLPGAAHGDETYRFERLWPVPHSNLFEGVLGLGGSLGHPQTSLSVAHIAGVHHTEETA